MTPSKLLILPLLCLLPISSSLAQSFSVGLEWDHSPSPAVALYRLYYGIPPAFPYSITLPFPITNTVVSNLPPSSHFQFYVTAINIQGLESLPSNVIDYYTPPSSTPPKPPTPTIK